MARKIPGTLSIKMYMHCSKCITENPRTEVSARDYAQISVGFTPLGIQVWCNRHECNIAHIDFQGLRHPANTEIVK